MDYDLKIIGAEIVDGSGREHYRSDVAVKDRRVVPLGCSFSALLAVRWTLSA